MANRTTTTQAQFDQRQYVRVSKRLNEAIGYLELGLNERAVRCLEQLGPLGLLGVKVNLVYAEAKRRALAVLNKRQAQMPTQSTVDREAVH